MGCAQSKIENEETVARCKSRKRFMKDAVSARNAFASAHSSYAVSLKHTGAALSEYGQAELGPLPSSHPPPPLPSSLPPGPAPIPLRPPPRPHFSPPSPPLLRSASMPEISLPKPLPKRSNPGQTISEEDEADDDTAAEPPAAPEPPPPPPRPATPPPPPPEDTGMGWDFFSVDDHIPGPSLPDPPEESHFKRVANSEPSPTEAETVVADVKHDEVEDEEEPPQQRLVRKKPVGASQHQRTGSAGGGEGRKGKPGHVNASVNLVQMLNDLDDHFLKASECAQEVTKMLEATRLHYHSNFADNRGHIDHSARVMKVITWNRSFKHMQDADDGNDDFDNEESETHATILDKLLAWEKKLYDEVKAGEIMKNEYQKKVALLERQKKRNASNDTLDKTKAAVSHMQTRCIVDMQSMDSTVSEIQRLRDEQLYAKLSALIDGMASMWETMHSHHESQVHIVGDLRALDISSTPKETTPQHFSRTEQLYRMSSGWHTNFQNLMNHQKEYVAALSNWLKLNVIPIESNLKEKVSSPPRIQHPPMQALIESWHDQIDKLPYDLAQSAISTFAAVINAVMVQQQEELKQKQRCEETRKELTRKHRLFNEWYEKHAPATEEANTEEGGEGSQQNDAVAEKRHAVDLVRKRLEEEEEELRKMCKQVREKAVGSLKSHLPELFRAMMDFSLACSAMYKHLKNITVKQSQARPRP